MRKATFQEYTTPDGAPTCATNFDCGHVCKFLRTRKFGLVDYCGFTGGDLHRGNGGEGWLMIQDGCPIWGEGSSTVVEFNPLEHEQMK